MIRFQTATLVMAAAALVAAGASVHASEKAVNAGGLDLLHFNFKTAMTKSVVAPGARGRIDGKIVRQGSTEDQRLRISLTKLSPNTLYHLSALVGDATNPVTVAGFTTNKKGAFTISYGRNNATHPFVLGGPLPPVLGSVCNIRDLRIVSGATDIALQADVTHANKWEYLVNRSMTNSGFAAGALGRLRIKGNQRTTQFRLHASGLTPSTGHRLTFNGTAAGTYSTDKSGGLTVRTLPQGAPRLLDIRSIGLNETAGNNVVLVSSGLGVPCTATLAMTPTITSKNPNPVTGSNGAQIFTINGTNFLSGLTVTLRDVTNNQTFTSSPITSQTSTQIVINPNFSTASAIWSVEVINPGNSSSGQSRFQVIAPNVAGQLPVPLGAAASFAILAGSTVTNIGPTTINGDLGVSAGSAVTGFPPGTVVGTQHVTDPTAAQAQLDLTTAYNDAAGRTLGPVSVAGNIGGLTLPPGLYKSSGSLEISSGDLTLDAKGDANAVFIFQIASTLSTTSGRQVTLIGNAKAANVFWQVGTSATLGTTTAFKGTIMADQSISLATGATLDGRALARIAGVTLQSNAVTVPIP